MKRCVCTIVSGNYLAYAKVLGNSLARQDEACAFEVLLVDRETPALKEALAQAGLKARFAGELGLAEFERLAYQFDILELNTALKPSFLKQLLGEGFDQVIYLDPDICCYAPLTPVFEALEAHDIVLTPHAMAPVLDGERPSDIDFLRNGAYNLGFVALRRGVQASALLAWWEARCLEYGFNDPGFGTFVDQKWMDLAPAYFSGVGLLRHPGCNVAYWNLHERQLLATSAGPGYEVNGMPLVFFHFSGVDVSNPTELSKHQTRHRITPGEGLAGLLAAYVTALTEAGHLELRQLPYGFAALDDGTAINGLMRRAALSLEDQGERSGYFSARSQFQRSLRRHGLHEGAAGQGVHTRNLHRYDTARGVVDRVVRLLARILGAGRVSMLLRYAALLSRESHLPSVLLRRPLRMEHRRRR